MLQLPSSILLTVLSLLLQRAHGDASEHNVTLIEEIHAAIWRWHEFSTHITVMLFLLAVILIKIAFRRTPYVAQYIPESLLLIIIGIIFGAIVKFGIGLGSFDGTVWQLTPVLFFNYLLPPILLDSAYSLCNRTFGEYLGVILLFAFPGTILNFLVIGFLMFGLYKAGALGGPEIHFDLKGMLLFSSLIVAINPLAVLAIFQDIRVKLSLYYIVLGESLVNDALTVDLFVVMSAFTGKDEVTTHEILMGIALFFAVSFGGFLVGVIIGVLSCLLTRIKSDLGAFILLLFGYLTYILAACLGWSGSISIIGCGMVQAAYAFHNLDRNSKTLVQTFTKTVSDVNKSVIFLFMGIEVFSAPLQWQTGFILWSLVLCLLSRALVVLFITAIVNAVNLGGIKISFNEQFVLIYGGLRGAIAFCLSVLVAPERLGFHGLYNRQLMITATLFIILFTVGFMGLTMRPLVRLLNINMQQGRQLSLFGVLNNNVVDEMMTGLEVIIGSTGHNRVRATFKRWDEKYFRRWLQREPETYDMKMMKIYEQIALNLHHAEMRPHESDDLLKDIPELLCVRYLTTSLFDHSSLSKLDFTPTPFLLSTPGKFQKADIEAASQTKDTPSCSLPAFEQCVRSMNRTTPITKDNPQVEFDATFFDMLLTSARDQRSTRSTDTELASICDR